MFRKGLIVFIITLFCITPVFAATNTINISGVHEVEGTSLHNGSFTFVLTAMDKENPMPEGSSNGVKKISVGPNDSFSFGEISFDKEGIYDYTVSRELMKSKDITYDKSIYHIEVSVFSDGTVASVMTKDGSAGKVADIKYSDKYVNDTSSDKDRDTYKDKDKQKTETTTQRTGYKTGDFLPYVLGVVFLVLVIAAIIVYRKRKKQ